MASIAFAPAVSPNNPVSARGYLVIPCIMAPEVATAAPKKKEAISPGSRMSRMTKIASLVSFVVMANRISFIVVSAAPNKREAMNIQMKIMMTMINLYTYVLVLVLGLFAMVASSFLYK